MIGQASDSASGFRWSAGEFAYGVSLLSVQYTMEVFF